MAETVLMNVKQVAKLLECSTRHVHQMANDARMPLPVRLGRSVRWNLKELERWIEKGGSVDLETRPEQITFRMIEAHQRGDVEARDTLLERLHDEFDISLHFADELTKQQGGDV